MRLSSRSNIVLAASVAFVAGAFIATKPADAALPGDILSLTSGTPTGYGSQLTAPAGTADNFTPGDGASTALSVIYIPPGTPGYTAGYLPGSAHVNFGPSTAFAQVNLISESNGQAQAPTPGLIETYGLALLANGVTPTSGQIAQIIADVNAQELTDGGLFASVPTPEVAYDFGSNFNLALTAQAGSTTFLGFDFSQETNVAGITVTAIAADIFTVPEPASLSLLACGGLALLGRRRRLA